MGLCNSPNIIQENISELFVGLDTVRVYIDDLLHVTKGSWTEHIYILEEMFTRLQKDGLKVNASKYCFGAHKLDAYTKESRGNSSPRSSKNSKTIASVYRCDQLLLLHV